VQDLVRLTCLTRLELHSEICWSDWALLAQLPWLRSTWLQTLELDPGAGAAGAAGAAGQLAELAVLYRLSTRRQQAGVGGGARGCLACLKPAAVERASIGGLPLAGCSECAATQHHADRKQLVVLGQFWGVAIRLL
jgi:hypothetical protein